MILENQSIQHLHEMRDAFPTEGKTEGRTKVLKGPAAAGLCPEKGVWERADACWKVSRRKSKKEMAQEGKGSQQEQRL